MKRKIVEILFTPVVFSIIATIFILWVLSFTSCSRAPEVLPDVKPTKASMALKYAKDNKMDTTVCILINFKMSSKWPRMSVVDLQSGKPISRGLTCHGMGLTYTNKIMFSNVEGSHLSSLGKYRIGSRGWSNWGINVKYILHGLDRTNSNAKQRNIVLHSWEAIPDKQGRTRREIVKGYGCPAVSNTYMRHLDKVLKNRKNVLLWIYV